MWPQKGGSTSNVLHHTKLNNSHKYKECQKLDKLQFHKHQTKMMVLSQTARLEHIQDTVRYPKNKNIWIEITGTIRFYLLRTWCPSKQWKRKTLPSLQPETVTGSKLSYKFKESLITKVREGKCTHKNPFHFEIKRYFTWTY